MFIYIYIYIYIHFFTYFTLCTIIMNRRTELTLESPQRVSGDSRPNNIGIIPSVPIGRMEWTISNI